MNDPDPLPVGAEGTVDWVNTWRSIYTEQIGIECDNGRSPVLLGSDSFAVIARASDGFECAKTIRPGAPASRQGD